MKVILKDAPLAYTPKAVPTNPNSLLPYLHDEVQRLEKVIATLAALSPQVATEAPKNPTEGMIRFSKSPWRPVSGQTADQWVTYVAGSWVYL